jgi:hypothetical protein
MDQIEDSVADLPYCLQSLRQGNTIGKIPHISIQLTQAHTSHFPW